MAKANKDKKTNAMRTLDAAGITYDYHMFETDNALSGVEVANLLKQDPNAVFKTLVTQGERTKQWFVFMIPVAEELDLKKASEAAGEKAIHMIKSKELLPLTGYIHGGCSPIGMKKLFPTFVDETAQLFDRIMFSGGRIGCQLSVAPRDLEKVIPFTYADLTVR